MGVTAATVRDLVAGLPGAEERSHHGHPDFRVHNKIFATLTEAEERAALRLTQLEARDLAATQPAVYRLVSDREPYAYVSVLLEAVAPDEFADLLERAWHLRGT